MLVEEAFALDGEADFLTEAFHRERGDCAHGGRDFAVRVGGEGGEVVTTHKPLRGFRHALGVEMPVVVRDVQPPVRQEQGIVPDEVAVLLAVRGTPRVEIGFRGNELQDPDVVGETRVQSVHQRGIADARPHIYMRDLASRVDTSVRSAAAVYAQGMADDRGEPLLDRLLDARLIRLELPPGIGRAVVGDRQLQAAFLRLP